MNLSYGVTRQPIERLLKRPILLQLVKRAIKDQSPVGDQEHPVGRCFSLVKNMRGDIVCESPRFTE